MQPSPIVIRSTMLRYLAVCERRVWLDIHADPSLRDELSTTQIHRLQAGIVHEQAILQATSHHIEHINTENWADAVQVTNDLIQRGSSVIMGGCFEAQIELKGIPNPIILRGKIDRLTRQPHHPENPHRQPIYTPIEIKSYLDISQADKLQLDMYCWLLTQAQGIEPPHAEFWLGQSSTSTQPSLKQGHLYDEYRLMRAIRDIAMIAISDFEPPPYITKHCHACHWYGACQKKPQASFDIGLLVGLRKETQSDLKKAGIDSLEQLVQLQPYELKQFRGINTTANFYHAQARAWVEQKPIWLTPLPEILKQGGWMFDLETYQDIHTGAEVVWSIGWGDEMGNCMVAVVVPDGKPHTLVINSQLTIYLTPNSDGAWRLMAQTIPDNKPIYHWTGYDSAMMKKSAPEDVQQALAHRLVDLHALFKKTVCFPISSLSIKAVAPYLGFRWSGDDYYLQAYLDYRRWLETFESDYLHHAVNYQADDVKALAVVWQYLTQNGD